MTIASLPEESMIEASISMVFPSILRIEPVPALNLPSSSRNGNGLKVFCGCMGRSFLLPL
ncbi:MAG: hypothetical protein ACK4TF_06975 [Thermodesulfovibrionales bacterium]